MSVPKVFLFLLICLPCSKLLPAQVVNDSVFQPAVMQTFQLTDARHKKMITLQNLFFSEPLVLFIFLSPECPLCKSYTPLLNALKQQYGQNVKFAGIISGKTYRAVTVNAFAEKYKINFSLLTDKKKALTNYLQASVTPEVILLNNQYELVYKGAIDNRVKQLGVQGQKATENYLTDAITQYLQHTAIAVKRKPAVGCLINDF